MLFQSNPKDCYFLNYGLTYKTYDGFDSMSPAYLFTNENLGRVFDHLNVDGKDVLTACAGSGDILFNAKMFGAATVDQFDVSLFSKHTFELKYQALRHLTYSEFLRFFYHSRSFLNKKSGDRLAPHLSDQAALLLGNSQQSYYDAEWIFRISGDVKYNIRDVYPRKSPYLLGQTNYDRMQRRLDGRSDFYLSELQDLPLYLSRQYDVIYLSNICQYIPNIDDFDDLVVRPLTPFLAPGGQLACYQLRGKLTKWSPEQLCQKFESTKQWRLGMTSMRNICARGHLRREEIARQTDTFFTLQKMR